MIDDHAPALCEGLFQTLVRNDTWYVPTHVTRRMEAYAGDEAFGQTTACATCRRRS